MEDMYQGAIIALRAALTFLIHWEIKNEESRVQAEMNSTPNVPGPQ